MNRTIAGWPVAAPLAVIGICACGLERGLVALTGQTPKARLSRTDESLLEYYVDIRNLLASGKEQDALKALEAAPAAPIRIDRTAGDAANRDDRTATAVYLNIGQGLARLAEQAAWQGDGQRAARCLWLCRSLMRRVAAAPDPNYETREVAWRLARIAALAEMRCALA